MEDDNSHSNKTLVLTGTPGFIQFCCLASCYNFVDEDRKQGSCVTGPRLTAQANFLNVTLLAYSVPAPLLQDASKLESNLPVSVFLHLPCQHGKANETQDKISIVAGVPL